MIKHEIPSTIMSAKDEVFTDMQDCLFRLLKLGNRSVSGEVNKDELNEIFIQASLLTARADEVNSVRVPSRIYNLMHDFIDRCCVPMKTEHPELFTEEAQANARLIAAAPEMYERLKLLVRLLSRQAQGQLRDPIDPAIADSIYELLAEIDYEPVETMKYSSSFFQNRNCEYFPCHEVENTERFSCLFCFCLLYHMKKCGGNYRILSNGVKDCSECTMPHTDYNRVISMLKEAERAEKQN